MLLSRQLQTVTILWLFCSAAADSQERAQKTITLTGGIEHAERLPPVPPQIEPGAVYNMEKAKPVDEWYRLPNIMAGTWETYQRIDDNGMNLVDGSRLPRQVTPMHAVVEKGRQIDARGDIWDCYLTGTTRQSTLPGRTRNITGKQFKLLETTADSTLTETTSTQVDVDSDKGRIVQVLQVECITRTKCRSGSLFAVASVKTFSKNGTPTFLTQQKTEYHRVKEFVPVNEVNGRNLRDSFYAFLEAKGSQNLIPNEIIGRNVSEQHADKYAEHNQPPQQPQRQPIQKRTDDLNDF